MLDSKKGIYAGSFDPVHNGHIKMAADHAEKVNNLTVGIGYNPDKAHTGSFHAVEKVKMLKDALLDLPENVSKKINVDFVKGLITNYCEKKGIKYIFKSYRNDSDYKEEMMQQHYNTILNPDIETQLIEARGENDLSYVSSSGEKMFMKLQGNQTSPHTTLLVKHALEVRINKQYIVGMTGEIGSGKSYTGEQFVKIGEDMKIPTHNIDFDALGHNILKQSENYEHIRQEIKEKFGDACMKEDGSINRAELGRIVFSDPLKLAQLNAIMKAPLMTELREALTGKTGMIIINSALLASHNLGTMTNNNIVGVTVDHSTQIARILARENSDAKRAAGNPEFTIEDAEKRIKTQLPFSEQEAYFVQQQAEKRYGKLITLNNSAPTAEDTKSAFLDTLDVVDQDLSLRFSSLYARLKLTGDANKLFQDIYFRYLNNNLPYHNRDHIKDGINRLYRLKDKIQEPDLVEIAWFFHDIIYNAQNTGSKSNELLSAELARDLLIQHGMSSTKAGYVYHLILATEHKCNLAYTHDEKYIMDIDKSILASKPDIYSAYSQGIRMEYIHYPEDVYKAGRTAVLNKILNKPIFFTPEFAEMKDIAEANILHEIELLK